MLGILGAQQKPTIVVKGEESRGKWLGLYNSVVGSSLLSPNSQTETRAHYCLPAQGEDLFSYLKAEIKGN